VVDSNLSKARLRWSLACRRTRRRQHHNLLESRQRHGLRSNPTGYPFFGYRWWTRTYQKQGSGGALLAAGLDGGNTMVFSSPVSGMDSEATQRGIRFLVIGGGLEPIKCKAPVEPCLPPDSTAATLWFSRVPSAAPKKRYLILGTSFCAFMRSEYYTRTDVFL